MRKRVIDFIRRAVGQPAVMNRISELEARTFDELAGMKSIPSQTSQQFLQALQPEDPLNVYDRWAAGTLRANRLAPRSVLSCSWEPGTPYYQTVIEAMMKAEFSYARDLLRQLDTDGIQGDIIEFGVFEGLWLSSIADHLDAVGRTRHIFGLDSFEGLPAPDQENDLDCWQEGQFSASFDRVSSRLKTDQRPHVSLVKGWFSDTLPTQQMQSVSKIAFARIDCDLYHPTVESLDYLTDRLVDGAILVFDDWTWDLEKGETKAAKEWIANGLPFTLDFLAYGVNGHLYLKVKRAH